MNKTEPIFGWALVCYQRIYKCIFFQTLRELMVHFFKGLHCYITANYIRAASLPDSSFATVNSWAKLLVIDSVADLTPVQRRSGMCFHILMTLSATITDYLMSLNVLDYVSQIISLSGKTGNPWKNCLSDVRMFQNELILSLSALGFMMSQWENVKNQRRIFGC